MDVERLPWHLDPETMGGMPVFVGTRVPLKSLFDNLAAGMSLEEWLANFPSVQSHQVVTTLRLANELILLHTEHFLSPARAA